MSKPAIILDEKATENGMAVMLADLLTQNMEQNPEKANQFRRLSCVVGITAKDAEVKLTMFFNNGSCMVYDGIVGNPDLNIIADSEVILGLSTVPLRGGLPDPFDKDGRAMIKQILSGQLKIQGMLFHPINLVRVTKVFSVN